MKTKLLVSIVVIDLTMCALAQPTPPGGTPPAAAMIPVPGNNGQSQAAPPQKVDQTDNNAPGILTNYVRPANTNWPNGTNSNHGTTIVNRLTNGIMGNPYANYTNPFYTYAQTNTTYGNPNWSNANRGVRSNELDANIEWSNINTNRHH